MSNPVKIWRNQSKIRELIGARGTLLTWTYIRIPPAGFSSVAPYFVALVELTNKKRVTVQLVDSEESDVQQGKEIELIVRRVSESSSDGIIPYGIKGKIVAKNSV